MTRLPYRPDLDRVASAVSARADYLRRIAKGGEASDLEYSWSLIRAVCENQLRESFLQDARVQ